MKARTPASGRAESATALLALWNSVAPDMETAYESWHAQEHVPERLTVPGMLWAYRWADIGGDADVAGAVAGAGAGADAGHNPRYLTLYGLHDAEVLDSAPYRRLLSDPTPESARMRPALRQVSRWVCRIGRRGASLADIGSLAVWTLPRQDPAPTPAAGQWLAERLRAAGPLPWLGDGQAGHGGGGGVEGDWLLFGDAGVGAAGAAGAAAAAAFGAAPRLYRRLPVGGWSG